MWMISTEARIDSEERVRKENIWPGTCLSKGLNMKSEGKVLSQSPALWNLAFYFADANR